MQGASQKATEKGTGIKVQNDNGESNINYNQSLTVFIHFCKALENTLSLSVFRETRRERLEVWLWELLTG